MKVLALGLAGLVCVAGGWGQGTVSTPLLSAAHKLQSDVSQAQGASSLSSAEKSQVEADTAQLVTNATLRAQGKTPDRMAGRRAAEDIGKKLDRFRPADGAIIKQDLLALQAAAK
jgi:hypothetical protein